MTQENQHHQAPGVDPPPPPPPPTSDPPPPAGAYPPPGQVSPPPQVQGHNQVPYVVPPPAACPMKNNEPEGDPQGPQQSAPFLHRRFAGVKTDFGPNVVLPCSGASSAICHYSETALQTAFLIPDQKRKAPFLIMCPRPKGMTMVGCQ